MEHAKEEKQEDEAREEVEDDAAEKEDSEESEKVQHKDISQENLPEVTGEKSDGTSKEETSRSEKVKEENEKEEECNGSKEDTSTSNYSDACSEATEGPEEGFDEDQSALKLDAYLNEADEMEAEATIFHHSRIPRSLLANDDDDDDEDDDEEDEDGEKDEGNEVERRNARLFVERLASALDKIVGARGSVETDHRIQTFASNFCHGKTFLQDLFSHA